MKRLKTKWFAKWARKQRLTETSLLKAIKDLEANLSTVNLGSGLFKVRLAMEGSGKSSGFRSIIVYSKDDRAIIVYGFAKNNKESLSHSELKYFRLLANDILGFSKEELELLIKHNEFIPIGEI